MGDPLRSPLFENKDMKGKMLEELKSFRTLKGEPYRLVAVPPYYANFLIMNGAILLPFYEDPDENQRAKTFPRGAAAAPAPTKAEKTGAASAAAGRQTYQYQQHSQKTHSFIHDNLQSL